MQALAGVNGLVLAGEQAPGLLKEHRKFDMKHRPEEPACKSQNIQCLHPNFGWKALIGGLNYY